MPERTFRRAGQDEQIESNPASTGESDDLTKAIAALWRDARPRTMARIETIERAVAALRAGALDAATAEAARREAHKLTGSLGTFGIPEGTERARALELALEDGAGPADPTRLEADVAALRRIVEESLG